MLCDTAAAGGYSTDFWITRTCGPEDPDGPICGGEGPSQALRSLASEPNLYTGQRDGAHDRATGGKAG